MNIAVLGGTFDPPHFGHLLVARQVLEHVTNIDEVWLLPDNTNPDKTVFASPNDRLAMAKLLQEPGIKVSDIDIIRGGETYTIDTIHELQKNKANNYSWVMGSDLLSQMTKWESYDEIISLVPLIIFPRPGFAIGDATKKATILSENTLLTANYSATAIRARVNKGLSIKGLVPDAVADYIEKNKLYKTEPVYV